LLGGLKFFIGDGMNDVKNKQCQTAESQHYDRKNKREYLNQNFPWLRFTKFADFYDVQYCVK
jgi:hypothetical protein